MQHKVPKRYGIIVRGTTINSLLEVICSALVSRKFEWQVSYPDYRLKCRTRINENEIWEAEYMVNDFSIEEYLKRNFIKFSI